jgi:release factor glutamine methyltransferase
MTQSRAPQQVDGGAGPPVPPVYPPREDSLLLLPFARVPAGTSLLEIGTGSGVAALEAARCGARVVATDLNPWALAVVRRRARVERLDLELVRTDLAAGLGRFERVLANPPYLPTQPGERDPDPWHNLALDGGVDGCAVASRLVTSLPEHLTPSGNAFVVFSSLQAAGGLAEIRASWTRFGPAPEVASQRQLTGERLEVWQFRRGSPASPISGSSPRG